MCRNISEKNRNRYIGKESKVKKAIFKALGEKAEDRFTELTNYPNGMLTLVRGLNIESKGVEGGSCVGECDGKLYFAKKE